MTNFILRILVVMTLLSKVGNAYAEHIPWRTDRPLLWSDFQGADPHSEFSATTMYLLNFTLSWDGGGAIKFTISCSFDQALSWKRANESSDEVLRHEQLHFNIAELYARKIRKAFTTYTLAHKGSAEANTDLKAIFDQLMAECKIYQDTYDSETDHSRIKPKQDEWDKKITSELQALDGYAEKN